MKFPSRIRILVYPVLLSCACLADLTAQEIKQEHSQAVELDDSLKHLEWLIGQWKSADQDAFLFGRANGGAQYAFYDFTVEPNNDGKSLIVSYTYHKAIGDASSSFTILESIALTSDKKYSFVVNKLDGAGNKVDSKEFERVRYNDQKITVAGYFGVPRLDLQKDDEEENRAFASFSEDWFPSSPIRKQKLKRK